MKTEAQRKKHREYMKVWYSRNADKVRAWSKRYRLLNLEKVKATNKSWALNNLEKVRQRCRNWKRNNPEKVKASAKRYHTTDAYKEWRCKNKDKFKKDKALWYQENREIAIRRVCQWQKDNPGSVNARNARRRARKKNAIRGCQKKVNGIYERCRELRQWFDVCVDHIIPLAFGGSHSANNLQIIYRHENCRKGSNPFFNPSVIFE